MGRPIPLADGPPAEVANRARPVIAQASLSEGDSARQSFPKYAETGVPRRVILDGKEIIPEVSGKNPQRSSSAEDRIELPPLVPFRQTVGQAKKSEPPPLAVDDGAQKPPDTDRAVLLGAARTAVKQGNFDQAVKRYEEYLKRYSDDLTIRREYAGVLVTAIRSGKPPSNSDS